MKRPAPTILGKLLLAYVAPTLILFAAFGWFSYDLLRRDLDDALGTRLAAIAGATAQRVRPEYLLAMDETSAAARELTRRDLVDALRATGAHRMYVFGPAHTSLCDTRGDVPVGQRYHELELDRHELARVFAGAATSSVLFTGSDGRLYKAGYAPLRRGDEIVAALRVEAAAEYFAELNALTRRLVSFGAALGAIVVVASFVVAARLTRPLRRLAADAARIGRGDLEGPIGPGGSDEIGVLARTLEDMRGSLRARDERLQMMLAGIAHEVRNPLGGIELYAGILREELAGDPEKLGHLRRIQRELGYLEVVVSDFLEYARRPKPELRAIELGALARELEEIVAADAAGAGVTLRVDTAKAGTAAADPAQLRRALLNLLRNAVQATPRGGQVDLEVTGTRLRVGDTGAGIPEERLARIFTPFFTTKEKGTGLGLAFVREIIGDHGGTLDVHSEVGRGTTFTIELPPWA